jgi:hypothetical protein
MAYFSRETANVAPYSVGARVYGGNRAFPTMGPVDPTGYAERDLVSRARRNAILKRMQAQQAGNYASADAQRTV